MCDSQHRFLFYAPELTDQSKFVELSGDEHHHLSRVLRRSSGQDVFGTNGHGVRARCTVVESDDHRTRLQVGDVIVEQCPEVALALACLKKEAFETAVKHCTELGVTRFLPFSSKKSHLNEYSDSFMDRLRRIALSAMKQSFRSVLPSVDVPTDVAALAATVGTYNAAFVGDPDAPVLPARAGEGSVLLVVGPEGGFTKGESEDLRESGCTPAAVSRLRLRSETAAAAMTTLLLQPRV